MRRSPRINLAPAVYGIAAGIAAVNFSTALGADWSVPENALLSPWGAQVTPLSAWQQYPRPQLRRDNWTNLNGLWDYAIADKAISNPSHWEGKILVPFPVEAPLSGVGRLLEPNQLLWYRRTFVAARTKDERVLLNFEAVDYEATVDINGEEAGRHAGSSVPFSLDVTDLLNDGENELVVRVLDTTDGYLLRGKQRLRSGGIFYTRVSGIWQTVWLERVPPARIDALQLSSELLD